MNHDGARRAFDFDSTPRQTIERFAVALERRVHRRRLHQLAVKGGERRFEVFPRKNGFASFDDLALPVACRGPYTELEGGFVGFVGIEKTTREFRRFAETQEKQAGRQGVERSGMPGFRRTKEASRFLECGIRRKPFVLVEQKNAVDPLP
jgi:hypothetical protein